jgi:hypothetical protein
VSNCDGGTCYAGCACRESEWAARLAAAEENYARECALHDKTSELASAAITEVESTVAALRTAVDRALAAESRAAELEAALRDLLAAFVCLHNASSTGDAEQWVEVQQARRALAPKEDDGV